jgi:hypothetical protein
MQGRGCRPLGIGDALEARHAGAGLKAPDQRIGGIATVSGGGIAQQQPLVLVTATARPLDQQSTIGADRGGIRLGPALQGHGSVAVIPAGVGEVGRRIARKASCRADQLAILQGTRGQVPAIAAAVGTRSGIPDGQIASPDAGRIGLAGGEAGLAVVEDEILPLRQRPGRQPDPGDEPTGITVVKLDLVRQAGAVLQLEAQIET